MLVTLTRHTQVDQSKGLWCFDTSPILGYTIGSNKQMYLGGDRGIPHGSHIPLYYPRYSLTLNRTELWALSDPLLCNQKA